MACRAVSGLARLRAVTTSSDPTAVVHRRHAGSAARERDRRVADFLHHGADAFADIATWKRYPDLLDLANFVVVARPGHHIDALASSCRRWPIGCEPCRPLACGGNRRYDRDLPVARADAGRVVTVVRERLRRGDAITGLVPPLVEAHIHQHKLYSSLSADQLHGQN